MKRNKQAWTDADAAFTILRPTGGWASLQHHQSSQCCTFRGYRDRFRITNILGLTLRSLSHRPGRVPREVTARRRRPWAAETVTVTRRVPEPGPRHLRNDGIMTPDSRLQVGRPGLGSEPEEWSVHIYWPSWPLVVFIALQADLPHTTQMHFKFRVRPAPTLRLALSPERCLPGIAGAAREGTMAAAPIISDHYGRPVAGQTVPRESASANQAVPKLFTKLSNICNTVQ